MIKGIHSSYGSCPAAAQTMAKAALYSDSLRCAGIILHLRNACVLVWPLPLFLPVAAELTANDEIDTMQVFREITE